MGFFSWKTSDTNASISNAYSKYGAKPVYLLCPDGSKIYEDNYEGYGVFGGKDVFALLALWNAPELCTNDDNETLPEDEIRRIGIKICDTGEKFPIKLVEHSKFNYDDVHASPNCPDQGFFY